MGLFEITVGALSTLVLGMSGVIWSIVSGFVSRDNEWKKSHSQKVRDAHKEIGDRITQLELRMIKEIANYATDMQRQVTHLEKELQQISNDLTAEYNDIIKKMDDSDYGKVLLLEERVNKITRLIQAMIAEKEGH